jgi:hypothetical protein
MRGRGDASCIYGDLAGHRARQRNVRR